MNGSMVMYDEEYQQIKAIIARLCADANAKLVFLVEAVPSQPRALVPGQPIDITPLARKASR